MAFNLISLCHRDVVVMSHADPVHAVFTGGEWGRDISSIFISARRSLEARAAIQSAVIKDGIADSEAERSGQDLGAKPTHST
eukprot:GABW01001166.1.p1 GENE.GABW01001166.1~~GABW01001166.1.p1  ORF type:complete len:82 (-),score=10.85 GABW01001166.1:3-248(-)